MRETERGWPEAKKEGRDAYIRRLKRTALDLPADLITKSIMSMKKRCALLRAAKGGQIEG